ncbi:FkbM family methyltransferase [Hyphomonas sp.]|uniref:FkbM family methyltransferase n=1 Tax=Hyphomonas sp. TaxID=87 RepID=UPI00391C8009
MTKRRGPKLSASRLAKWLGRRIEQVFSARKGTYVFEAPPYTDQQTVLNRVTRARTTFRIRTKNDLSIAKQIFESEDYRLERLARHADIRAHYDALLKAGKTPLIIDCGGNIGLSALYFSEHFPQARVVTVEPGDDNFATLSENCRGRNILPVHAAISAEASVGRVVDIGRGSAALQVVPDPEGDLVFTTVPALMAQHGGAGAAPFIVKIDIEGFEQDLFSRPAPWLDEFYLVVMELHDWMMPGEARSGNFLRAVAPLNRDFVHIHENIFSISNRAPAAV